MLFVYAFVSQLLSFGSALNVSTGACYATLLDARQFTISHRSNCASLRHSRYVDVIDVRRQQNERKKNLNVFNCWLDKCDCIDIDK